MSATDQINPAKLLSLIKTLFHWRFRLDFKDVYNIAYDYRCIFNVEVTNILGFDTGVPVYIRLIDLPRENKLAAAASDFSLHRIVPNKIPSTML